jgi:hypothetical protein
VLLAGNNSVIFFFKFFIGTQLEISVGFYRKQKILTEYRIFFCLFWLVGLSPGNLVRVFFKALAEVKKS